MMQKHFRVYADAYRKPDGVTQLMFFDVLTATSWQEGWRETFGHLWKLQRVYSVLVHTDGLDMNCGWTTVED